jgi:hypothetical protein
VGFDEDRIYAVNRKKNHALVIMLVPIAKVKENIAKYFKANYLLFFYKI